MGYNYATKSELYTFKIWNQLEIFKKTYYFSNKVFQIGNAISVFYPELQIAWYDFTRITKDQYNKEYHCM